MTQRQKPSQSFRAILKSGLGPSLRRAWASLQRDIRGLAGIEFGMICGVLAFGLLNVADVTIFLYDHLQVNEATQMGAQAAWTTCDLNHLPATSKCPNMSTAVTASVQSTSLQSAVKLVTGFPSDAYYCVNASGALQYVSDYTSPPNNCSVAGNAGTVPGEYIEVQTTFTYTPLFPGLTVAGFLPATITSTSWTRLH